MIDKMGGPAFPHNAEVWTEETGGLNWSNNRPPHDGMTLWDYYAAAALAGLAANPNTVGSRPDDFAEDSTRLADVMLAERTRRFNTGDSK